MVMGFDARGDRECTPRLPRELVCCAHSRGSPCVIDDDILLGVGGPRSASADLDCTLSMKADPGRAGLEAPLHVSVWCVSVAVASRGSYTRARCRNRCEV